MTDREFLEWLHGRIEDQLLVGEQDPLPPRIGPFELSESAPCVSFGATADRVKVSFECRPNQEWDLFKRDVLVCLLNSDNQAQVYYDHARVGGIMRFGSEIVGYDGDLNAWWSDLGEGARARAEGRADGWWKIAMEGLVGVDRIIRFGQAQQRYAGGWRTWPPLGEIQGRTFPAYGYQFRNVFIEAAP